MSLGGNSAVAALLGLVLAASAPAQFGPVVPPQAGAHVFQVNPFLAQTALGQAALAGGLGGLQAGGRLINTPVSITPNSSYGGGNGYLPPPLPSYCCPYGAYYNPIGGYYTGVADLTIAYGRYIQDFQKGRLLNQEVERSKSETRMRLYNEWRYYESMQPKAEDIRRDILDRDLSRARKQAPTGEILAGKSLNDLLGFLKTEQAKGRRAAAPALDEELLKQINVTTEYGGNMGLIKSGKISWPLVLKDEKFNETREKLDQTLENAVNRAKLNGRIETALMKELETHRKKLDDQLDNIASNLEMGQQIEARRYLTWLGLGMRALSDPNVANYFNRKYEARGKTVADLVEYMTREGLKFGAAVPGNEGAYRMLYIALVAYDEAIQLVSR